MSILWMGGEDIDFPNGGTIYTSGGDLNRSGWARCSIATNIAGTAKSTTFQGGAVTSAWLTFQLHVHNGGASLPCVGVGQSGSAKALYIGTDASNFICLYTYDGTTLTKLASSANGMGSTRFDVQISNFGTSCTVKVYIGGTASTTLILTYTGDVTMGGAMTNFDSVFIYNGMGGNSYYAAEIIVSSTDTRAMPGLVTLALTGAGGTDAWTSGTYSNINGTIYSDANPAYTNTTGQDEQFTVNGLPSGTWTIAQTKITLRAAVGAGATATQVNPGYYSGSGSPAFGGPAQTAPPAYGTLERYDTTNPVTATAWAQADFTGLQLDLRSA